MKKPTYKYHFANMPAELFEGESIEEKCRRIVEEGEPISDGAPMIYTPKADGVIAAYNIRTDRWEIAQEAMTAKYKADIARSKENANKNKEEDKGGSQPDTTTNVSGSVADTTAA